MSCLWSLSDFRIRLLYRRHACQAPNIPSIPSTYESISSPCRIPLIANAMQGSSKGPAAS